MARETMLPIFAVVAALGLAGVIIMESIMIAQKQKQQGVAFLDVWILQDLMQVKYGVSIHN
jgi:hypothetical protein